MFDGIRPFSPPAQSTVSRPQGTLPPDYGIKFHLKQSTDLLNKLLLAVMNNDGLPIKEIYDSYQNEMSVAMYLLAVPRQFKNAKHFAEICEPAIEEQYVEEMADSGYAPIVRFIKLAQNGSDVDIEDPQQFLKILNVPANQKSLRHIADHAEQLGAIQEYVDGFRAMLPKNAARKLSFDPTDAQVTVQQNDVDTFLHMQQQNRIRIKLTFDSPKK